MGVLEWGRGAGVGKAGGFRGLLLGLEVGEEFLLVWAGVGLL